MVKLILDVAITSRLSDTPSWVPDWNRAAERCYFDPQYLYDPTIRNITSSMKLSPAVSFDHDGLLVAGTWVDSINLTSGLFSAISDAPDDGTEEARFWDQLAQIDEDIHKNRRIG